MMPWPAWLWIGTPLKAGLWIGNRLFTWTGLLYFWRRFRSQRFFWLWLILINTASLGSLCLLFFWLHLRSSPR